MAVCMNIRPSVISVISIGSLTVYAQMLLNHFNFSENLFQAIFLSAGFDLQA
jgi:hypothetical protein